MAAKGRKKLKSYAFIRLLRLLAAILLPRSVARPVIVPFECRNGAVGCPRSGLRCPEFARFTDIFPLAETMQTPLGSPVSGAESGPLRAEEVAKGWPAGCLQRRLLPPAGGMAFRRNLNVQ